MSSSMTIALAVMGLNLLVLVGLAVLVTRFIRKVPPGQALLVVPYNKPPAVFFSGQVIVYPRLNQAHAVDLTQREFVVERRGREGIVCKDGTRFEVRLVVRIRIERTREDVIAAFEQLGADALADPTTAEQLFRAPAVEALREAIGAFDHEEVPRRVAAIRDEVENALGSRAGFKVHECVLEDIEPVPAVQLDPNDLFDARTLARLAELKRAALS